MQHEPTIRWSQFLTNEAWVIDRHWPIHFSGMAVFIDNVNIAAVVVTAEESTDGVIWTAIVSGPGANDSGGCSAQNVGPGSSVVRTIHSTQRYVRFSLATVPEIPVKVWLVEYPPKSADLEPEEVPTYA